MKQKAYIRPGRAASVVGIIAGVAMLLFGIFFLSLLMNEESMIGTVFMIFWLLVVVSIIGYYAYNLISSNPCSTAAAEIEIESSESSDAGNARFSHKLRSLEDLRKDGLLTEEEYARKREEIMQQKW